MPTRSELNNNLASILTPIIEVSQHLQANQEMLDYVDQEIAGAVSGNTWPSDKPNYYTKTQVDSIASTKADLVSGKIPSSQLPSYVDDIIETANYAALPVTGETGKLYITLDDNKLFRWSGSVYIEILSAVSTGTTVGSLQQVTTVGNTTTNNLSVLGNNNRYLRLGSDVNTDSYVQFRMALGSPMLQFHSQSGELTSITHASSGTRDIVFPDASGTMPMTVNGVAANSSGNITLTGLSSSDTYVTGGTYSNGTATFRNNTGGTFNVTGFSTGNTEVFVTGGTYTAGTATFRNNTGGTFSVTGFTTGFTSTNVYNSDGVVSSNRLVELNDNTFRIEKNTSSDYNSSLTFNEDYINLVQNHPAGSGSSVRVGSDKLQLKSITPSESAFIDLTSLEFIIKDGLDNIGFGVVGDYNIGETIRFGYYPNTRNDVTAASNFLYTDINGQLCSKPLSSITTTDRFITGGTYSNGTATFTNNTGGTFNVTGFKTSDLVVTGGTHSAGTTTFRNNTGGTFTVTGYQNGNSTITLTGVVTGTGTSSIATSIGAGAITNTMLAGSISDDKILSSATWNGKADKLATIKAVTGTTYTILSGDNGTVLNFTNVSGCSLTTPSGLTNGFNCLIIQGSFYPVEVYAGAGATLNKKAGLYTVTNGQYSTATLLQIASNQFLLAGDLENIP